MGSGAPETIAATVKELFAEASELSAERRAAFLNDKCAGDGSLREAVEALLSAHHLAGRFLSQPTAAVERACVLGGDSASDSLPRQVDRFRLMRLLGEGGFGNVYLAEQEQPVRREVALKIIKPGMDSRQVIARFQAERQALAMMDHPNIARVFDAGTTESGLPYFVMELVNGPPITAFCDEHRLPVPQRLELFMSVCMAVGHAHHKGVIHRDIKPSNVLVATHDGNPVPKVIDFGVAKATHCSVDETTAFTALPQLIGTLEYMSPEQADLGSSAVDTRSDIYSLGVLLCELLSGRTPFADTDLRSKGYSEAQRILREVEPPRPSDLFTASQEKLPAILAFRQTDRRRLAGLLRGELDWVVMKCLEKDRERRYSTAAELAQELRRFLEGEPVSAGPATALYRLRRFISRYRTAVAAVVAVVLALLTAILGTTLGLLHAKAAQLRAQSAEQLAHQERNQARQAQQQAEQNAQRAAREAGRASAVSNLLGGIFALAKPESGAAGEDARVDEVIQRAATQVDLLLRDRPEEQLLARKMLAEASGRLYLYDVEVDQYRRAYELSRALPGGENSERSLYLAGQLAMAMYLNRRGEEAVPLARATLTASQRLLGDKSPVTWEAMHACAVCLSVNGTGDESRALLKQLVEVSRPMPEARTPNRLGRYLSNLAVCLRDRGDYSGATAALREAAQLGLADTQIPISESLQNVLAGGWVVRQLVENGDFPEAIQLLERQIDRALAEQPQGTPTLAYRLGDLAMLKIRNSDTEGAARAFARAQEIFRQPHFAREEAQQDIWRQWTLCCNLNLLRGWHSLALRRQVWCALEDLLRDNPPARLAPEEVKIDQLRFRLVRWNDERSSQAEAFSAEGGLAELKALPDPPAGLYLLGLEVPRLDNDPLRRANWLLLAPWTIERHPVVRFDGIRTDNTSPAHDWTANVLPFAERSISFGLGLQDALDLSFAKPNRLQWFTTTARSRVQLPAGRYRLSVTSDDGVQVWVDGHEVIRHWRPHPSTTDDGTIDLSAGGHELTVEHFQETGSYSLWLQVAPMLPAAKLAARSLGGGVPEMDCLSNRAAQLVLQLPGDPILPLQHAQALARAGRFIEASAAYARLSASDRSDCPTWQMHVSLLAYIGQSAEASRAAREMYDRFSTSNDPVVQMRVMAACAMLSPTPLDNHQLEKLVAGAPTGKPTGEQIGAALLARSMAEYRLKNYSQVLQSSGNALEIFPPNQVCGRTAANLLIALASRQLGRETAAQAALKIASDSMQTQVATPVVDDLTVGDLDQWLQCQMLWKEAGAIFAK